MNNVPFDLKVDRPPLHWSSNFPDFFKPEISDSNKTIITHFVAKDEVINIDHIRLFDNLILVHLKIGNIKTWILFPIKSLHLK